MIAHLCIIENALVWLDPIVFEHSSREWIVDLSQGRSYCSWIIFRQCPRIRARIGDNLVPFIKRLRDLQCAFRGEPEPIIRFALQGSEIIELRSDLRARLLFFQLDDTPLATAFALDRLGDFTMPQSPRGTVLVPQRAVFRVQPLVRTGQVQLEPMEKSPGSVIFVLVFLEGFIEPATRIFASSGSECADDLVQLTRLELLNLALALDDNCQRRRLHAAE